MPAYLDTGAFGNLYRKVGCTSADIANLRKAIYGRELSLRLSIHTLEEILLGRRAQPQALAAQTKLTLSLANARTLLKPCDQLLLDDIRSYAANGHGDRPFLRGDTQNTVAEGIAALIESDGEDLEEEFVAVLEESRTQRLRFLECLAAMIDAIRTRTIDGIDSASPGGELAPQCARMLASRADVVAECDQRGIDGMLALRSVQTFVGAAIVMAGDPEPSGREPREHAGLAHAVSAAAVADTFVTDDRATRDIVQGLGLENFRTTDLGEFLSSLRKD